ncbi:UNVERIFIED_CONTAM: hypothetical protein Sradi_1516700 [Sesamum radiatum]|uniref:Uncharacterized protein n=1 Tax=Sesamum radiatum TaxID=300843 RepID=A0AAW2U877_SESRA
MDDLKVAKKEVVTRCQKAEKEMRRLQREVKALQEEQAKELWVHADQVHKEFPKTEEGKNLLEACWASRLAEHKKSDAYLKEASLVAGLFLRFAFEASRQQFLAQGYPPTGEDTSFLNFELLNPLLRNQEDLNRLLGEAEAKVRDAPGQMKSGAIAEKVFEEEPPQPTYEDAASPSKESPGQEEDA